MGTPIDSIPPPKPETASLDGAEQPTEATAVPQSAEPAATEGADGMTRIAALAEVGDVGPAEMADQLLGEALAMEMVRVAPAGVRAEIKEVLGAILETDPGLIALLHGTGR